MALVNCKECGRLFNRSIKDICPACVKHDEDDFFKVSGFLRDHRGASPQEVHEATEVPMDKIYRFIREGRLIAANFPSMTYPCERCGTPIQIGRFCRTCTDELKHQFDRAIHQEPAATQEQPKSKNGSDYYTKNRFGRK